MIKVSIKQKERRVKRALLVSNYFFGKILNMPVPQFGQAPFMAGRVPPPLAGMVTSFASFISRLALHLTQYPSIEYRVKNN